MNYRTAAFLIAAAMLGVACQVNAQYADPGPVGLVAMERFDLLPYLWNGVNVFYASSYDRSDENTDRSKYVYDTSSEHTFMDVQGPGCVYRLWITSLDTTHEIRFYLDNDATPRFKATIANLFSGTYSPFLTPLVGYSSGGYYCYLPIQFKTRCRIATPKNSNTWFYYNINYMKYADESAVTTTTGLESSANVRSMWNSAGNPNPAPDAAVYSGSQALAGNSSIEVADIPGPAAIKSLSLRIPAIIPNDALSDALLENVWLRIFWDNQPNPAVDAPIGDFYGSGLGEYEVASLPVKMSTAAGGWYSCYFPMPFGSRAKVEVYNKSATPVPLVEWDIRTYAMPDAAEKLAQNAVGYFHAFARSETPTTTNKDYLILQTAGKGAFVGVSMSLKGLSTSKQYLEGDERIYIDGNLMPSVYGTGTEDFFNGGWYFKNGSFTRPSHGNPSQENDTTARNGVYRYFLSDKLPFYGSIKVGLEHGDINDVNANYSSVAYYYRNVNSGIRITDEINIGDSASEIAHGYSVTGQTWAGSKALRYEGADLSVTTDEGRTYNGSCAFTVEVDPANIGVKLRRKMDYSLGKQSGTVWVDGQYAGVWYESGSAGRWRDSDFEIPAALTSGKSSITVQINSSAWTEYRYRAYSYVPVDIYPPSPVTNAAAVAFSGRISISWNNPADPDLSRVVIRSSLAGYPSGPEDGDGVADIQAWADKPETVIHSGLVNGVPVYYSIFACDAAGHWSEAAHLTDTPRETTTGSIKQLQDGSQIELSGKVVTALSSADTMVYVQDPERCSGIRIVNNGAGLAVGDIVNVSGTISTRMINGAAAERQIVNPVITKIGSGQPPAPLAIRCSFVGGEGNPPLVPGVNEGIGPSNIGLLVKITGKVQYASGVYLVVDDGSAPANLVGLDLPVTGVMVKGAVASGAVVGDIVSCVGIVEGSVPMNWTMNRRLIHCRQADDIVIVSH